MRICLVLEGCYPYVFGGVSTWMHQYINQMQEHEFVLWVIGENVPYFFRKRTRKSERADADEETGLGDVVFPVS